MSRIYLNEGWKFTSEFEKELLDENFDDSVLETVRIPHTVKELPYHYFDESKYQMVSGYRRVLFVPNEWENKRILFTCEGSAHESVLYVNGKEVWKHSCGYTAFSVDITEYLVHEAENVLVLKVDSRESLNIPPFGFVIDYMTFGGIYRDVYLEVKEPVYIENVFVKGNVSEYKGDKGDSDFFCEMKIESHRKFVSLLSEEEQKSAKEDVVFHIRGYLRQRNTNFCSLKDEQRQERALVFETTAEISKIPMQQICIEEVKASLKEVSLWSPENPALYILELEVLLDDKIIDTHEVCFGFRNVEFKADGFYLNGLKLKIRGLNRHQSYPYVGYAMPECLQKKDADILKFELGCNAARTSHYPQSHYFMDRCDEIGLLVFTEIPGWQHIGDENWKEQACKNAKDMILQYRNHVSIMLWGVRINESGDDDKFYSRTNTIAHALDDTRPTGGVRAHKKSNLLEDVYTYNDFLHDGEKAGCEPKKNVTSDMSKAYLVSEYNGHMYPTKAFDGEEHRVEHALRHVRVLDAVAGENDISGSFAWCMFDYNTHKDFGSGDRICYHGVMDMFRNPKLAASVYACQQDEKLILELSSSMDIGEHPATNLGKVYMFTNADSVRMYKNDHFIKEFKGTDSSYKNMKHGPILVDDFVGDLIELNEKMPKKLARKVTDALNYLTVNGYQTFPPKIILLALECILIHRIKPQYLINLYTKYIGNWGGTATEYRFDAIKDGKVMKSVTKKPMTSVHMEANPSHTVLEEKTSYDVAEVRIRMLDEKENLLPFFQEAITITTEGPIEVIGPKALSLKGGMGGVYVRTTGEKGAAKLILKCEPFDSKEIEFEVK